MGGGGRRLGDNNLKYVKVSKICQKLGGLTIDFHILKTFNSRSDSILWA